MIKKYAFGVDIGGTTVKIGLFETSSGSLLDKWKIITKTEENGQYILSDIAIAIEDKLMEKRIIKKDVEGIGLGVPGPVSKEGIVYKCVNLGWGIFNVEKELSELTDLKVKVGNDANVAALGEMWQGGGKGYKNVVMVTLGTGVGGGIIMNGKIVSGHNGAAGEIGHLKMKDDEKEQCGCGGKGCLEQYASATGIVHMAKKILEDTKMNTQLRKEKNLSSKKIIDAAQEGDPVGILVLEEVGSILGKALANLACIIDPEIFVIGGGVSNAGDILLRSIIKNYQKKVFHACHNTEFSLATLGNDAGIYGGVKLVL